MTETIFFLGSKFVPQSVRAAIFTLVFSFGLLPISAVNAETAPKKVLFDVGSVVSCRDVTPPGFANANPGEKILEARIQVSVLSQSAPGQEISELLIRIESPDQTLQVFDYSPKTTLTSNYVGPVTVEHEGEQTRALDFNLAAHAGTAQLGTTGSQHSSMKVHSQAQQLAPSILCAASGTTLRGHGVYFKLRPTVKTAIEGAQDLSLQLQVPDTWRADYLVVNCEAFGLNNGTFGAPSALVRRGARSFIVAIHLEGDQIAKARAFQLIRAERELKETSAGFQQQVKKQSSGDPIRGLENLFKGREHRVPENWMEQVLFTPPTTNLAFDDKLPGDVRAAVLNFRDAKRQMQRMKTNASVAKTLPNSRPTTQVSYAGAESSTIERLPPVEE